MIVVWFFAYYVVMGAATYGVVLLVDFFSPRLPGLERRPPPFQVAYLWPIFFVMGAMYVSILVLEMVCFVWGFLTNLLLPKEDE